MVVPDPFSAIMNTIALVQLLQTTITNFVEAKDDERTLIDQIRVSALALGGFVKFFSQIPGAGLSGDDEALMAEVCDRLQPSIQSMRDICIQIYEEPSRWGKFRKRMTWVTYRKQQIEALAAHMRQWSTLFNEVKGSLPSDIRMRLERHNGETESEPERGPVRSLNSLFTSSATSAASMDVKRLEHKVSDVTIVQTLGKLRAATFQGKVILVEYKKYDSGADVKRVSYIEEQIGRLCNFLALADPITTGILACSGWIAQPEFYRFGLLFRIPLGYQILPSTAEQGTVPRGLSTLRSIIASGRPATSDPSRITYAPKHALDERVATACMVTIALFYLHSYSWVHENLRTSNVLMLAEKSTHRQGHHDSGPERLGRPFLIGYDAARSSQGVHSVGTNGDADSEDEKFSQSLFSHPDRQEDAPGNRLRYQMCHDQYSLGAVLLEIGLWMPLEKERTLRELRRTFFEDPLEKRIAIKHALVKLAEDKLALTFGTRYQSVVLRCLATQSSGSSDLSRFLYDVVAPLWELKSSLA